MIATCRRVASGGKFRGSIASQLDVLEQSRCCRMPVGRCRIANARQVQAGADCRSCARRPALILSFHDFRATKKLDETLEKMLAYPADYLQNRQHCDHALPTMSP